MSNQNQHDDQDGGSVNVAGHQPVLVEPVVRLLDPRPGNVILDCTVGLGGHAMAIIPKLIPGGRYVGLDVDPANLAAARRRLADAPVRVDLVHANFAAARAVLDELNIAAADGVLADFGFASPQVDDPARGFSFQNEGPLDMRLDPSAPTTAAELVNTLSEPDLADLIYQYGEERLSRRIARKIVEARRESPIKTTTRLAEIVRRCYPRPRPTKGKHHGRRTGPRHTRGIDPATRTFQALRIAVNGELDAIESLLAQLPKILAPGGVAVMVSFHSLEDRLVKQAFAQWDKDGRARRLTRKPIVADEDERRTNPRSRSAKLRAIRFA